MSGLFNVHTPINCSLSFGIILIWSVCHSDLIKSKLHIGICSIILIMQVIACSVPSFSIFEQLITWSDWIFRPTIDLLPGCQHFPLFLQHFYLGSANFEWTEKNVSLSDSVFGPPLDGDSLTGNQITLNSYTARHNYQDHCCQYCIIWQ